MKKVGLIGGTGPESTIPYYRGIVYGVQKKAGEKVFPNLTIESINVFEVLELCGKGKYEDLTNYLMKAIHNLIASGVDFIALTGNTPHIVFDELQKRSSVPLVSGIEATCNEAKRQKLSRVGLLGTIFTMEGEFFKKPFMENQIEVVTPTAAEKEYINKKILHELELGLVKQETVQTFLKIIERMKVEKGIQAIILGCTELPLLFKEAALPVACLDAMAIHIQTLVKKIVEEDTCRITTQCLL